jgi:hypothetical protein
MANTYKGWSTDEGSTQLVSGNSPLLRSSTSVHLFEIFKPVFDEPISDGTAPPVHSAKGQFDYRGCAYL